MIKQTSDIILCISNLEKEPYSCVLFKISSTRLRVKLSRADYRCMSVFFPLSNFCREWDSVYTYVHDTFAFHIAIIPDFVHSNFVHDMCMIMIPDFHIKIFPDHHFPCIQIVSYTSFPNANYFQQGPNSELGCVFIYAHRKRRR